MGACACLPQKGCLQSCIHADMQTVPSFMDAGCTHAFGYTSEMRACLTKCSVLDVATIMACSTSSAPNTLGLLHVVTPVAGFTQYGRCVAGSMYLEICACARRIARQRAQYLLPSVWVSAGGVG